MISTEDKSILRAHSSERTTKEWIDYFEQKYTKGQIYGYCYHNNLPLRQLTKQEKSQIQSNNSRKYYINQDFFKTWSRDMAYILGLWFADGCIYKGQMFDITLHKKDKYILKKVAEILQYEGQLYDYVDRQAARLNFSCVVIYNDIIALGGKEAKSNDIQFPQIPKEYLADFIRGYFDGDGSVIRVKNKRINTVFCSGSSNFLKSLQKILQEEIGIEGGSINRFTLRFGKRDSIKLGKFMYQNNPNIFLLRKKEIFDDYIN